MGKKIKANIVYCCSNKFNKSVIANPSPIVIARSVATKQSQARDRLREAILLFKAEIAAPDKAGLAMTHCKNF